MDHYEDRGIPPDVPPPAQLEWDHYNVRPISRRCTICNNYVGRKLWMCLGRPDPAQPGRQIPCPNRHWVCLFHMAHHCSLDVPSTRSIRGVRRGCRCIWFCQCTECQAREGSETWAGDDGLPPGSAEEDDDDDDNELPPLVPVVAEQGDEPAQPAQPAQPAEPYATGPDWMHVPLAVADAQWDAWLDYPEHHGWKAPGYEAPPNPPGISIGGTYRLAQLPTSGPPPKAAQSTAPLAQPQEMSAQPMAPPSQPQDRCTIFVTERKHRDLKHRDAGAITDAERWHRSSCRLSLRRRLV